MGFLACPICGQVCDGETGVMSHAALAHERVKSETELSVMALGAKGMNARAIGRELGISAQRVTEIWRRSMGETYAR